MKILAIGGVLLAIYALLLVWRIDQLSQQSGAPAVVENNINTIGSNPKAFATIVPVATGNVVVASPPSPSSDPDPLIICKSKTGDIEVRRSLCLSYTDCPDGYGGYVFESTDSCRKRWEKIAKEFNELSNQYSTAMLENLRLQKEILDQSLDDFETQQNEYNNYLNNLPNYTYEVRPLPTISPSTPQPSPNYEGTILY